MVALMELETKGHACYDKLVAKSKELRRRLSRDEAAEVIEAVYVKQKRRTTQGIPRKRNELLDALVEACGGNPAETTRPAFRAAAVALADIQAVCPNLTRDELFARAARYKSKHRDWPLTPPALCKHWADLGGGPRTSAAKRDVYIEPNGWRELLVSQYNLDPKDVSEKTWFDLGYGLRHELLQKLNK